MQNNFTPIDNSLIKNCISGNRKSQKKLYDLLAPKMYPVCLKFFKKSADAEDVLQEGCLTTCIITGVKVRLKDG